MSMPNAGLYAPLKSPLSSNVSAEAYISCISSEHHAIWLKGFVVDHKAELYQYQHSHNLHHLDDDNDDDAVVFKG